MDLSIYNKTISNTLKNEGFKRKIKKEFTSSQKKISLIERNGVRKGLIGHLKTFKK